MKTSIGVVALMGLLVLAGCGTSERDRTTGGAAAGAATGAGVGALAGPVGVVVGGVIGGGAGAIAGATTSPSDVNLGKPVWDNPSARVPTPNGVVAPATGQTTKTY
jgi:phage tail tape-measure protein